MKLPVVTIDESWSGPQINIQVMDDRGTLIWMAAYFISQLVQIVKDLDTLYYHWDDQGKHAMLQTLMDQLTETQQEATVYEIRPWSEIEDKVILQAVGWALISEREDFTFSVCYYCFGNTWATEYVQQETLSTAFALFIKCVPPESLTADNLKSWIQQLDGQ